MIDMVAWIDERIKAMFESPRSWGSDEAIEMQVLLLLEMRAVAIGEDTPLDVVETYNAYLTRTFPTKPNRPLFQIVESEPLGNNLAAELRRAVVVLAPDIGKGR